MAELLSVKLPAELNALLDDLKDVRSKNLEPTSNISIITDAVKAMHKNKVKK